MNPMIMMSVPVLMDTSGYDNGLNDVEYGFMYTEKETMGDMGGLDNILRFDKNVDSGGAVQVSERGDVTKDDEDSGDEEEAQQVELPPEGNDEPVEEMHEGLNKFPPDNFANEPTAV